ncbi:hypothetical protein [Desertivirga brevis]|uniref:hypothetical protein n=1 Tax=Desertivirga brevis TaxID=2810310 RepID=UPI001A977BE5|nr:hypothetical protein [Pedobacter sp. SYSU D00873]
MKLTLTSIILLFVSLANGQKLPKVQEKGLWVPNNIKIDGKAAEWKTFQAFNPSTQIYYTLANDQENLYFVVKSTNLGITSKILRGGITLNLKSLPNNPSVSFPKQDNEGLKFLLAMTSEVKDDKTGLQHDEKKKDSVMFTLNRKGIDRLKEIQVAGLKDMPDTVISVYNDLGILCRSLFDENSNYVYEMSVPLQLLNIPPSGHPKFSYDIKLNGVISKTLRSMPNPDAIIGGKGAGGIDLKSASSTTSCSGSYTLLRNKDGNK